MRFDEPHPSPKRSSPSRLSTSGQTRYQGWSCNVRPSKHSSTKFQLENLTIQNYSYDTRRQLLNITALEEYYKTTKSLNVQAMNFDESFLNRFIKWRVLVATHNI
jgi:hypothetical protein